MKLFTGRAASIRVRLTLLNMGVMALILAAMGLTLRYSVPAQLLSGKDRELAQQAEQGEANRPPSSGLRPPRPPGGYGRSHRPPQFAPRMFDAQGHSVRPDLHESPWDATLIAATLRGERKFGTVYVDGEPMRVFSMPRLYHGKVAGALQFASSLAETQSALDGLTRTLLLMIPLALLVCGISGVALTNRAIRPVTDITEAAGRIGAGTLSERLVTQGNDEFARLGDTFNGMLARLEDAFTRQQEAFQQLRRFTADASHELRTPLTAIKGNVSLALESDRSAAEYRRALEVTNRAADLMNKIVQDLLLLARADAGELQFRRAPVPVGELLREAAEMLDPGEHAEIRVEPVDPSLEALGEWGPLSRVIINLVDNALRHTPVTGSVRLCAEVAGGDVVIQVRDNGAGIAPEHLAHLGERFYRVDAARARGQGGTGLGLAICKSIIESHDGSLEIASTPGEGATVTLHLPLNQSKKAEG